MILYYDASVILTTKLLIVQLSLRNLQLHSFKKIGQTFEKEFRAARAVTIFAIV